MIKKQEFYEGAALCQLLSADASTSMRCAPPFHIVNENVYVLLKYCTRSRSPWGFTLTSGERVELEAIACSEDVHIGLVCGSDGVAAVRYADLRNVLGSGAGSVRVACYRKQGQHYLISGPNGVLDRKVAPSRWRNIGNRAGET